MSRLSSALLAALVLHGALFMIRARHIPQQPLPSAQQPPVELDEVELAPTPERPAAVASAPSDMPRAASARAGSVVGVAHAANAATTGVGAAPNAPGMEPESSNGIPSAPAPASSAQADANASAPSPINLHLADGFFMRPPDETMPRVRKPEFQRQLEASILADDVKRGAARGNVLLGSLNEAVRSSGPLRGEALLSVVVGADGSVSAVELVRGATTEWASAFQAFRALAARKRVRVPAGARGLRVTFSVQSKVELPSGKSLDSGGSVKPSGLGLSGTFDVSDIGAIAQHMVYAHVVSEEVL